jgi:cytochrome c oxidase assembly factor CtaG
MRGRTRLVDTREGGHMSVTALVSWLFVFGIPAWLVIEELGVRADIWPALEARPGLTVASPARR